MRAYSGTWFMLAGLAAIVALNSRLPGAEPTAKDEAYDGSAPGVANDGGPTKKSKAVGASDPVAAAFALPKKVVLNTAQQEAYDALKQKHEAALRQAFDDVQHAEGAAATAQALREVRETRAEIRAGIQEILGMPYREAAGKASQSSGASAPAGEYAPQSGGNYSGGYYPGGYYPGGYYLGGYYPGGYYPGGPYRPYSTSEGTKTAGTGTGSSSTTAKPTTTAKLTSQPTYKPTYKPTPKPTYKPTYKPTPKPTSKPTPTTKH